jgi:hypothetical protein
MAQNKRIGTKSKRTDAKYHDIDYNVVNDKNTNIPVISDEERAMLEYLKTINIESPEKLEKFIFFRIWLKMWRLFLAMGGRII